MKKDKFVIISCYHFLCKSESENSVSSWFYSISFHQIEVWFCLISWKMNLVLSHLTEKKFDLILLKLLSFSVSSHFMKKNPILFHLMKIKSDSVSFYWKKILFCPGSDLGQNWIRTENPDSCSQSSSVQQVRAGEELLYTESWLLKTHMLVDAYWLLLSCESSHR